MRVHYVNKARKSKKARTCRCGHVVEAGEPYKWAEPRYGAMLYWCKDHSPKRSELTSSKLGQVYDAQDEFDVSEMHSVEEISEALSSVAEVARDVASEYEEGIENMPEGLQEGQVAEEMREKIDALESFADELESWEPSDLEEFDEDEARTEAETEVAQEMIHEMEDNLVKVADDSDFATEMPVAWIQEHGDEADFTSRVHALIQTKHDEWDAENNPLDGLREEANDLINNLEV